MPRKPRLHVPGGLYHVILRDNNRQAIFFDDDDRHRWQSLLAEGLSRYGHRIHAYFWMTNHIHMAVQRRTVPVAQLMIKVVDGSGRNGLCSTQFIHFTQRIVSYLTGNLVTAWRQ